MGRRRVSPLAAGAYDAPMSFEVYSSSRPGRPRVLLLISAGVLAVSLGLAWLQVHGHRALGPPRSIPGTPLSVRAPLGWVQDENDGGRFVLPTQTSRRRAIFEYERRIEIDYAERPSFIAPLELLQVPEFVGPGRVSQLRSARIGKYRALEVVRKEPQRVGRTLFERETLVRFTCLPRGQIIKIVYEPLVSLRPADEEILDDVCASLKVDDPTLAGDPDEFLARAGLELPLEDNWSVVGADFADVPGVYIGGTTQEGPAYSLAVLRTWLTGKRKPTDLLADLAAEKWIVWDIEQRVREVPRVDGPPAVTLRHPAFGRAGAEPCSAWVVTSSTTEAVIVVVYASASQAEAADEAAAIVATTVKILPLEPFTNLAAAEAHGRRLVADLHEAGPVARWGRERVESLYQRQGRDEIVVDWREAVGRDPSRGYQGEQLSQRGRGREERVAWTLSADARVYEWVADLYVGRDSLRVSEVRSEAKGPVQRRLSFEREGRRWQYEPGLAFVPRPAEPIVNGWVARDNQAALIEMSSLLGPGTHTVLLRPLSAEDGKPRVLVQQDFWPAGRSELYDDARGVIEREISASGVTVRIE